LVTVSQSTPYPAGGRYYQTFDATEMKFHRVLKQPKYRLLYSSSRKGKPGPKDPSPELIQAIVEFKRRNPRFGCPRIAQQINLVHRGESLASIR
jgi:hypothetical protein